MYKLKYKDYLFYNEFCYIKYKNKEFSNFDELKRYLYKHPYNVGRYDIIIINTNVRIPYTKDNFFKRLYTLDSSNARLLLDKFSTIRHVYISKNLDEIYGESVEVFNFTESFDFGLMYANYEILKKHDIVEIDPYFADSIYDWQCTDISLIIKYGMVDYCDYNKDSLFSKCLVIVRQKKKEKKLSKRSKKEKLNDKISGAFL